MNKRILTDDDIEALQDDAVVILDRVIIAAGNGSCEAVYLALMAFLPNLRACLHPTTANAIDRQIAATIAKYGAPTRTT